MKRILIFSLNYYPHYVGGAEVAIKEITDRIDPEEIEFHMVTLRIDSTLQKIEKIGNVTVHRIGFTLPKPSIADLKKFPLQFNKYYFQIGAYWKAARLQKKYSFDAVWGMMAHSCAIPAGLFKKKFSKVAYVLTLQEGDPPEHIERMMKPVWGMFSRGFTSADAVQPISMFLKHWAERRGVTGIMVVIPNGVDVKTFSKSFTSEEIRAEHDVMNKKEDEVYLITTSRLVHKNGIDSVIRALPLLPEHVHFIIYGIGPDEEKLKALAAELGVTVRTHFKGARPYAELPLALKASDIFIRPSRSEGMGNSFIEAMAAGIPVIATQEGGIADFLFDANRNPDNPATGWAVDVNSPKQIAEAVESILANPEAAKIVTSSAKKYISQDYEWDSIATRMMALFMKSIDAVSRVTK
jgi:glycosyltransferase involved in cell wall biosynthesis